ncbi:hypothetical protein BC829DRAFT_442702 [Chytridium lagenaria]|nr:hypothetical protein BC829DRAFT_442702 [Chytridium lagenaria]
MAHVALHPRSHVDQASFFWMERVSKFGGRFVVFLAGAFPAANDDFGDWGEFERCLEADAPSSRQDPGSTVLAEHDEILRIWQREFIASVSPTLTVPPNLPSKVLTSVLSSHLPPPPTIQIAFSTSLAFIKIVLGEPTTPDCVPTWMGVSRNFALWKTNA